MKSIKLLFILLFSAFSGNLYAQGCSLCKMDINDVRFIASAEDNRGHKLTFDATECLVNYLKLNAGIKNLKVTDYNTGEMLNATSTFYLKSKAIASPMGANISAYATEKAANAIRKTKGGEVMNWLALLKRFESSKFGSIEEQAHSHHHHASRPDMYAPAGIMGDHMHGKGGKMLSFSYMNMAMNGNRQGTEKIADEMVYDMYNVAPQSMNMQMFMLSGMYAISDKLTVMAMQNFVVKDMSLTAKMMMNNMPMLRDFNTASSGLGDLKLSALVGVFAKQNVSFHLNTGISIPLGSIEKRGQTPMNESAKLPYAMQLSSGTYDATWGGTLRGSQNTTSWGVQQLNIFRIGENKQSYTLGNTHEINAWGGLALSRYISSSIRLNGVWANAINGKDAELMPMMVPTAKGENYKRQLIRTFVGLNAFAFQNTILISAEMGLPVYQNNAGVFMNETLSFNANLKLIL